MARRTVEELVDDLDGSPAAETISFGLDGEEYQIDLSKRNAAAFRRLLDRYVQAAQGSASSRTRQSGRRRTSSTDRGYDLAKLREWAAANNIGIPARGRIPGSVVEQFVGAKRTRRRNS
jgi:hypothetical protein